MEIGNLVLSPGPPFSDFTFFFKAVITGSGLGLDLMVMISGLAPDCRTD